MLIVSQQPGTMTLPISVDEVTYGPITYFTALAKTLANHYFDFKFLSPPQQCGDNCDSLLNMFGWDTWMSEEDQNLRKYVIDIDGNGWSGRFHRFVLFAP